MHLEEVQGPMTALREIARTLVSTGRGILAADESITTMSSRLEKTGVEPTEENRRSYRELLVTTPKLSESISGIILSDETFRQQVLGGRTFPEALAEIGILAGIKVDTGAKPLALSPGETVTEGLDGLRERLGDYAGRGASFAKWRAALTLDASLPSAGAISVNAHALARYAALCQEAGLVPIVEPELLMDGDHDLQRCAAATADVLDAVFLALLLQGVDLAGIVLKPNMVLAGTACPQQASVAEAVAATLAVLQQHVPEQVPGIAFLSGGQPPELATAHLAALSAVDMPWQLTFSFGRALVDPALRAWAGDPDQWKAGQSALAERVRANACARAVARA